MHRFQFISSSLGTVDYAVSGETGSYRVRLRHSADFYERSIHNGGDASWQRDVVGSIGLLRRADSRPIDPQVVAEFNAWREAEFERDFALMKANPERYGVVDRTTVSPPPVVQGGHYVVGEGWQVVKALAAAREEDAAADALPAP